MYLSAYISLQSHYFTPPHFSYTLDVMSVLLRVCTRDMKLHYKKGAFFLITLRI